MEKQLVFCEGCGHGFADGQLWTVREDCVMALCDSCKDGLTLTEVSDIRAEQYPEETE